MQSNHHGSISLSARHAAAAAAIGWLLLFQTCLCAARIKDITTLEGQRINQLTGFGLVTGLNGTGGRSPVTRQFALNVLQNYGLRADPLLRSIIRDDTRQRTNNISVVTVTADLPVNTRPGDRIDVTVSVFDDATSLQGGVLLPTPLFGVDNAVYAVAAGVVKSDGFSFDGNAASVQKNHPTVGLIPMGATVEEEVRCELARHGVFQLLLRHPDYTTAQRIAEEINRQFPGVARAIDAAAVQVLVPQRHQIDLASYISAVQQLPVHPDMMAKVVINERTGTVVIGEHVRIAKVAIAHANLAVLTSESPQVSQPAPFSEGETTVVPRTQLEVLEPRAPMQVLDQTVTVADLAAALNALGVTPRDLAAIFQQLHAAGALHAELQFH